MITIAVAGLTLSGCGDVDPVPEDGGLAAVKSCPPPPDVPVKLPGGTFTMGQDAVYAEEGPRRETYVDAFWIDPHEVTNRQFAAFVAASGYVTAAEKPVDPAAFGVPVEQIPPHMLEPGSAVFTRPERPSADYRDWWAYVPGASWRKPFGPDGPEARPMEPVVHLTWDDMQAYAKWKRGRLPTEAEWEYAAAANGEKSTAQPGPDEANSWQGAFPIADEGLDGFKGIAPVGCYRANAFGLFDMVGNAWEMTSDFFRSGHDPATRTNPRGPDRKSAFDPMNPTGPSRVVKGGSYLCAPNYCRRYRPESRQARDPTMGTSNVSFRLAYDRMPD